MDCEELRKKYEVLQEQDEDIRAVIPASLIPVPTENSSTLDLVKALVYQLQVATAKPGGVL